MILLDNYIRNTVQASMLVVISMLTTLDVIFSMLDQMADTDEYFSIQNAVTFVLLTTPTTVYEMLPFAALGGALIGLGIISSNNELVVMRSSGVSVYRIVFSILKPTFLIMLGKILKRKHLKVSLIKLCVMIYFVLLSQMVLLQP